jgi:uncharacterized protein
MEEKIKEYLSHLEKENEIEILLACETGSRSWGFPSPDSDFDVRIIYKHQKDWYLGLTEGKDTIERFFDKKEIDISGWDLRKSLRLLWKSNPPLLERIQSPIIYKVDHDFLKGINSIAQNTYSRIATIHHYLNMGKSALEEVLNTEQYKLKRFFYALRASVACVWIFEKEEIPPMEFWKMYMSGILPDPLTHRIDELIEFKSTVSEAYMHNGEAALIEFMKTSIERAEKEYLSLPASKGQLSELNDFFIKTLGN